ncbi:hydrogenase expression protein [Vibrio sp. UCD-FRSSP16_10]|uniref:ABC transporter ATP-binding protein n=1 Tax=unclassified Vibrio TaxID=2614977 RepID=UPI0007FEEC62|nr:MULTISPECIES: ABC transporter ATP-binding protein [unclassified Vibrio]OBT09431.1 hydrogenase expression protein [Vibrio sp. UCD-FRSSP16_30]OBT22110.1 hydrogenase expression protein [Vibrio sp. UCD-FRSSP16_10]
MPNKQSPQQFQGIAIENGDLQFSDASSPLFKQLNLSFAKGSWSSVLGKSGCGKTSLLRLLAGLLPENVQWQGQIHSSFPDKLSDSIAYMAQQDLLMPWLSVLDNVCFSDRFSHKKLSKQQLSDRRVQAMALLEKLGLSGQEGASPRQLSGGMRQRVALARTLMQDKPVVLMDEPFSALDAVTRYRLQDLACKMLEGKTVVLITHDPQEALRLSDRIYLMQSEPMAIETVPIPDGVTPRLIDAQMANLQQHIIEQLGGRDE